MVRTNGHIQTIVIGVVKDVDRFSGNATPSICCVIRTLSLVTYPVLVFSMRRASQVQESNNQIGLANRES